MSRRRAALAVLGAGAIAVAVIAPGPLSSGGTSNPPLVPAATGAGSAVAGYAYVQSPDHGNTYVIVSAGGNGCCHRQVSTHQVLGRPAFSPNGRYLAFSGPISDGSDGHYGIFIVGVDGRGLRLLTNPRYADQDPAWSPDSRTIAFSRDNIGFGSGNVLGLVNVDGTSARAVAGTTGAIMPAWSPDSRYLTYAAPDGIHVIGAAGGANRLLYSGRAGDPAWSPNGQRIAFVRHDAEASDTVMVVAAAGGTAGPIENVAGSAETPGWSADSTTVHFLDFLGEGEEGRGLTAVWKVQIGQSPTFVFGTGTPQLHLAVNAGPVGPPPPVVRSVVAYLGTDDAMHVRREDASGYTSYGGSLLSRPSIVSAGGVAYYFAQGADGNVWGRTGTSGWSAVGPQSAVCASPAAAVVGSTLTLACRDGAGMLRTGTATLTGVVPTVSSLQVVGGPIVSGPAAGVIAGQVTLAATVATRGDGSNLALYAGGSWTPRPMTCAGAPGIGGWTSIGGWIACTAPAGTLQVEHMHAPGQWSATSAFAGGHWTGAVGVATGTTGYAWIYTVGSDHQIWRFSTHGNTFVPYGGSQILDGPGAAEIVTP